MPEVGVMAQTAYAQLLPLSHIQYIYVLEGAYVTYTLELPFQCLSFMLTFLCAVQGLYDTTAQPAVAQQGGPVFQAGLPKPCMTLSHSYSHPLAGPPP